MPYLALIASARLKWPKWSKKEEVFPKKRRQQKGWEFFYGCDIFDDTEYLQKFRFILIFSFNANNCG